MTMTSSGSEVGIPDLAEHLREYIELVRAGEVDACGTAQNEQVSQPGRPARRQCVWNGPEREAVPTAG